MQSTVFAFSDVVAMEADLQSLTEHLSTFLKAAPSDERDAHIRQLWPQIDRYRVPYTQALQTLRTTVTDPNDDNPQMAAARRQMLVQGPRRVSIWERVENLVARQLQSSSFPPLITERTEIVRGPQFGAVNYLSDLLFAVSSPLAAKRDTIPEDHYADIPLSGAYFINLLTAARRLLLARGHDAPVSFLDMGCGGGSKVLTASAIFETAHGIEFMPDTVAHAQTFFESVGADKTAIQQGDALTFDRYGDYDVLYFYRPLKAPALAAQMEERVLSQAKPGAIIIAPLNATLGRTENATTKVTDRIYLAHSTDIETAKLRDLASTKGCETRISLGKDADTLGFWEQVVTQSRRNGFALS